MFCDLKAGVILVAEDNPDEAFLLQRAFRKTGIEVRVHVCSDGNEAADYLRGTNGFEDRAKYPVPALLITDLKMPRCDGFELLERTQNERACAIYPRIVLSASGEERDVRRAYSLGANCYLQKPAKFDDLVSMMRALCEFWRFALVPQRPL